MIDNKHPTIVEMRRLYRGALTGNNEAYTLRDSSPFGVDRRVEIAKLFGIISDAKTGIERLMVNINSSSDMTEDEKGEYLSLMRSYLTNVNQWHKETKGWVERYAAAN